MRALLAACREQAQDYNTLPKLLYVHELERGFDSLALFRWLLFLFAAEGGYLITMGICPGYGNYFGSTYSYNMKNLVEGCAKRKDCMVMEWCYPTYSTCSLYIQPMPCSRTSGTTQFSMMYLGETWTG